MKLSRLVHKLGDLRIVHSKGDLAGFVSPRNIHTRTEEHSGGNEAVACNAPAVFLGPLVVSVVGGSLLGHLKKLVDSPLAACEQLIRMLELILADKIFIEIVYPGCVKIGDGNVGNEEIILAIDGKLLHSTLIVMASVSINILEIVLKTCQIALLRELCGLKGADYDHIILIVTAGNASADGGVHSIVAAAADLLDLNTDIILQLIVTELDSFLEISAEPRRILNVNDVVAAPRVGVTGVDLGENPEVGAAVVYVGQDGTVCDGTARAGRIAGRRGLYHLKAAEAVFNNRVVVIGAELTVIDRIILGNADVPVAVVKNAIVESYNVLSAHDLVDKIVKTRGDVYAGLRSDEGRAVNNNGSSLGGDVDAHNTLVRVAESLALLEIRVKETVGNGEVHNGGVSENGILAVFVFKLRMRWCRIAGTHEGTRVVVTGRGGHIHRNVGEADVGGITRVVAHI